MNDDFDEDGADNNDHVNDDKGDDTRLPELALLKPGYDLMIIPMIMLTRIMMTKMMTIQG